MILILTGRLRLMILHMPFLLRHRLIHTETIPDRLPYSLGNHAILLQRPNHACHVFILGLIPKHVSHAAVAKDRLMVEHLQYAIVITLIYHQLWKKRPPPYYISHAVGYGRDVYELISCRFRYLSTLSLKKNRRKGVVKLGEGC